MANDAFLGMRTTQSWVTDERPKNWMEQLAILYPNGMMDLTNLSTLAGQEMTDDPEFNHWEKELDDQRATITGVYTNAGLSSAYTTGGVVGDVLYFKMTAADVATFVAGMMVQLRNSTDPFMDTHARVVNVDVAGASSYIACQLWEADTTSSDSDLSDADNVLVVGTAYEEGADTPKGVHFQSEKRTGYAQIYRRSLSITGTALVTRLRRNPQGYAEDVRETREYYGLDQEKSLLFSVPRETVGEDGEPLRTTAGVMYSTRTYAKSGNISNYKTDPVYAGKEWTDADGGIKFFEDKIRLNFRFGNPDQKLGVIGDVGLAAINELARRNSQFRVLEGQTRWGMKVHIWTTPFGTLTLKTHPLFSQDPTLARTLLIYEPKMVKRKVVNQRATRWYEDPRKKQKMTTNNGRDKIVEEMMGEEGFRHKFPQANALMYNLGVTNTYSA
jgi:hypothetical protein